MSGKRVLAVYAALLLGFAVVLCRLYLLALHPAYAARAAAQSTVTLQLPARRGNFFMMRRGGCSPVLRSAGRWCAFPGRAITTACMPAPDAAGQALFVPQPQPRRPVFAGGELRPHPSWPDRLPHRPAVCRSAAVSAPAGLSGRHGSWRCRAGKGAGRCTFRHRGAQQSCLRRDGAGYAAHRGDAQAFASRQRGAGRAADHLPSRCSGRWKQWRPPP